MLRALVLCLVALAAFAQQGDLTLSGIVINSKSGEPIKQAMVTVVRVPSPEEFQQQAQAQPPGPRTVIQPPPGMFTRNAFSDSAGEFHLTGLPAGKYRVSARKPEFTVDLAPDRQAGNVDLATSASGIRVMLSPLGVITGRITDQDGLPVRGVSVVALQSRIQDGTRRSFPAGNSTTDDRGVYRFWSLQPGKYFIRAAGFGGGTNMVVSNPGGYAGDESFGSVYFGGGKSIDSASPVEIGPGTEATADFALKAESAFNVTGTVSGFAPRRAISFEVRTGDADSTPLRAAVNNENGRFRLQPLIPGSYILRAAQETKTAETLLTVRSSDVSGVSLALMAPVDIPVNTHMLGKPTVQPRPGDLADDQVNAASDCLVRLEPTRASQELTALNNAGVNRGDMGFIRGVTPGKYRVILSCFGGYPRSAMSGRQDLAADPVLTVEPGVAPSPIEIVASIGGGSVKGRLTFDGDGPTGPAILLVPQFSSPIGAQMTLAFGASGQRTFQFGFSSLAPGSYTLYAFRTQDIEFRNPEFLRTLSGGTVVRIDGDAEIEVTLDGVIQ